MVDHLDIKFSAESVPVLCMYCNYKERVQQTVPNLIGSLLKQLVQYRPQVSENVLSLFTKHKHHNTYPALADLSRTLRAEIQPYSKVFIVVDALDECPDDSMARTHLLTELRSFAGNVNLLVTSRNLTSIGPQLPGANRIQVSANDDDVRKYIKGRLLTEPRLLRHIEGDSALRQHLEDSILEKHGGMSVYPASSRYCYP